MQKSILDQFQKSCLKEFVNSSLSKKFYLSGGTALSEFYLQHRYSEDLDFFTQEELDFEGIRKFVNDVGKKNNISQIEIHHGYGLYTFYLQEKKGNIRHKIDFGQYPFEPIDPLKDFDGLRVETMFDISVNKAQTIIFRPRLRDFVDLYFILNLKKDWDLRDLIKKSFEKFEMKTDKIQIVEGLLQVKELSDMPRMIKKIDRHDLESFFMKQAEIIKQEILKNEK